MGRSWCLDAWWLMNHDHKNHIVDAIDSYFALNSDSMESAGTIWEVFKAVLWGDIISQQVGERRRKQQEVVDLETNILEL